jgi:hypothetical protein
VYKKSQFCHIQRIITMSGHSCITGTGTAVRTAVILQVLVLILNYSYKMLLLLVMVLHYCLKSGTATVLQDSHFVLINMSSVFFKECSCKSRVLILLYLTQNYRKPELEKLHYMKIYLREIIIHK